MSILLDYNYRKEQVNIPAAPTDPESLRAECAKEESPFTVAVLSKSDRRFLKSYQFSNP